MYGREVPSTKDSIMRYSRTIPHVIAQCFFVRDKSARDNADSVLLSIGESYANEDLSRTSRTICMETNLYFHT